ncbi:MAG: hypothetical protein E6K54_08475 [Gammaproteobacteria bacterium]|nr:MAG: hypothetical protein E6K54_08475 [Gammaproteobacteria bacterium]
MLYYNNIVNNIKNVTDSKKFWQAINFFKKKDFNGKCLVKPNEWLLYFEALLNPPLLSSSVSYCAPLIVDEYLDADFTSHELEAVLAKAKNNKTPGSDGICYEYFKNASKPFLSKIINIFNLIYKNGKVPKSFKKSIIFPLHKKGDRNRVENYRGLSFIDCVAKLFTSLVDNRLVNWVNEHSVLSEYQACFRKGYSTVE